MCYASVLGFGRPFDSSFENLIALLGSIRDAEEDGVGWESKRLMHHFITQVGEEEVVFSVHEWESTVAPLYPTDHSSPFPPSSAFSQW